MFRQACLLASVLALLACEKQNSADSSRGPQDSTINAQPAIDSGTSWLDVKTGLWSGNGAAGIPLAPVAEDTTAYTTRCMASRIQPATAIERDVVQAGWTLVAKTENHGGLTVVTGAAEADGMCRPWNYQIFAFINDQFAGTVSPTPMFSRIDGSAWGVKSNDSTGIPTELTVNYSRYAGDDPLCCPSAESIVSFKVVTENGRSRIVPADVTTRPTKQQ